MTEFLQEVFLLEEEHLETRHLITAYKNFIYYWHSEKAIIKKNYCDSLLLSEDDIFPISAYTTGISNGNFIPRLINSSIRNGTYTPLQKKLIELLDVALSKIPKYNNQTVYRMVDTSYIDDFEQQIDLFKSSVGKSFIVNHFLSTSKASWSHKMTWKILTHRTNSQAHDIEMMSAIPINGELEVLFSRGSKFQIMEVEKFKNYVLVTLREIPLHSKHSFIFKNELVIHL